MLFAVAVLISLIIGFTFGLLATRRSLRKSRELEVGQFQEQIQSERAQRRFLQGTVGQLKEANRQYIAFFVTIPEAIKRLSSLQRKDEVCSAIIRLAKDLVDATHIALFLTDSHEKPIYLAFGYGLRKELIAGAVRFAIGEGKAGAVAEVAMLMTGEQLENITDPLYQQSGVSFGVPIRAGKRLLGVLMFGPIPRPKEQDRRFVAMLGDLAAITLLNAERLELAQDEANIDPLTKLYNRRYFQERLLEEKAKCLSYGSKFSILIFDIDHFKNYNDTNGHPAGDALLKALSDITRSSVRGTDIAARYGGEEFIVLFRDVSKDQAFSIANQLRQRISAANLPFASKQPLGYLSISGGIATFPTDSDAAEEIVKLADQALYRAKKAGRNQILKYSAN